MEINQLIEQVNKIPDLLQRIDTLEKIISSYKPMVHPAEEYESIKYFLDKYNISDTTFAKARKQYGSIPEKYRFKTKLLRTKEAIQAIKQYQPVTPVFKTKKAAALKQQPKLHLQAV